MAISDLVLQRERPVDTRAHVHANPESAAQPDGTVLADPGRTDRTAQPSEAATSRTSLGTRSHRWNSPRLRLLADMVIILFAAFATITLPLPPAAVVNGIAPGVVALAAIVWLSALAIAGAYRGCRLVASAEALRHVSMSAAAVGVLVAVLGVLLGWDVVGPALMTLMPLGLIALVTFRLLLINGVAGFAATSAPAPTIVVGAGADAVSMVADLENAPGAAYRVVEVVAPPEPTSHQSWLSELQAKIKDGRIRTVALTEFPGVDRQVLQSVRAALRAGDIDVVASPNLVETVPTRHHIHAVGGVTLAHLTEEISRRGSILVKRVFDAVAASAALLVLSPLLLGIAAVVRLTSPGPALFRQERIGLDGRTFSILKFRTMVDGAASLQTAAWEAGAGDGVANKLKNDPRVTPVGNFLRRSSLDELPQLLNIVRGDMSLVGPRPVQRVELDDMTPEHLRRHSTLPGITGLWQISGRSDTSWDQRMRLDVTYVEQWSFWMDIAILISTVRVVVSRKGAY